MSACRVLAGRHGLLVLGQTRANTAWCRPSIPLCGSFPAPSTPLSAPSVCGVTECGSKTRKGDILDRGSDLRRPFVGGNREADTAAQTAQAVDRHTCRGNAFRLGRERNLISYG